MCPSCVLLQCIATFVPLAAAVANVDLSAVGSRQVNAIMVKWRSLLV